MRCGWKFLSGKKSCREWGPSSVWENKSYMNGLGSHVSSDNISYIASPALTLGSEHSRRSRACSLQGLTSSRALRVEESVAAVDDVCGKHSFFCCGNQNKISRHMRGLQHHKVEILFCSLFPFPIRVGLWLTVTGDETGKQNKVC